MFTASWALRILIGGVVLFCGGCYAMIQGFTSDEMSWYAGLGLGTLGVAGGVGLMALGLWLFNKYDGD